MKYTRIMVPTDKIDEASALLVMQGAVGTEVVSQSEDDLLGFRYDFVDEELAKRLADKGAESHVCAYFPKEGDSAFTAEDIEAIVSFMKDRGFEVLLGENDSAEWQDEWKKYLKDVDLGRFYISMVLDGKTKTEPEFLKELGGAGKKAKGEITKTEKEIIYIQPAQAFGTGMHETTKLCIELLGKYVKEGCRLSDIGTGSGILAIAAKKLGAGEVLAIDIDPAAIDNARVNLGLNNVSANLFLGNLDEGIKTPQDIIIANISAKYVVELLLGAKKHLRPGGIFICSGIIEPESEKIKKAIRNVGLELLDAVHMGDWHAFAAKNN